MALNVKDRISNLARERCSAIDHVEQMVVRKELKEAEIAVLQRASERLPRVLPFVANVQHIDNGRNVVDRTNSDLEFANSALTRLADWVVSAEASLERYVGYETGFYDENRVAYYELALMFARHADKDIVVEGEVINTYERLSKLPTLHPEPVASDSPTALSWLPQPQCMDHASYVGPRDIM